MSLSPLPPNSSSDRTEALKGRDSWQVASYLGQI